MSHQRLLPVVGNEVIAEQLEEVAQHLTAHHANPFRIKAYQKAAETIRQWPQSVADVAEHDGVEGLEQLPAIGRSLARSIAEMLRTGTLPLLGRFRGEHAPERILTTVPDIGSKLAERIHDALGIETLAELQRAAWDGRLAQVPGMGPKRLQAVRESLAGRLKPRAPDTSRVAPLGRVAPTSDESGGPPVAELLDIDAEYRRRADRDELPKIAPRRFNPFGEAWLPILHTTRGARHYSAMFSNTARAHDLGTTRDWVVIYRDDDADHGQWTVITSGFGPLRGRRILRGREAECVEYYEKQEPPLRRSARDDS